MPVLLLKKVNENNFIKDFDVGEHVIGRGPLLLCESKKVSRKHGMLRVTETEGIFFHAIHNNPCFYQSCNETEIRIISFGKNVQINNDDKICLSLDDGWFKVQIKTDSSENEVKQNTSNIANLASTSSAAKRGIEDIEEESPAKKSKMSDKDNNDTILSCNENNVTNNELEKEIKIEPVDENADFELQGELNSGDDQVEIKKEPANNEDTDTSKLLKVKEEKVDENDCSNADDGKSVEVKKEKEDEGKKADDANKNDDQPSTSASASKVWKDRCWYGSSCYRKNLVHRSQFRHPGDADYDSDPNDTRPICSYGKECYRKNKEHRKRLRHAGQDALGKPAPQKRKPHSRFVRRPGMTFDDEDDDDADFDVNDSVVRVVNDNFDCFDDSDIEIMDMCLADNIGNVVVRLANNHSANDSGISTWR